MSPRYRILCYLTIVKKVFFGCSNDDAVGKAMQRVEQSFDAAPFKYPADTSAPPFAFPTPASVSLIPSPSPAPRVHRSRSPSARRAPRRSLIASATRLSLFCQQRDWPDADASVPVRRPLKRAAGAALVTTT